VEKSNKSSIEAIVDQALQDGYLTPAMEAEVGRICDSAFELSVEEYMSLDRLMGALLTGDVIAVPRKQFINVMEELVLNEAVSRVAEIESNQSGKFLDLGDIAAYALNRLPPLYATTEQGSNYQRERALEDLQLLIAQQVKEAIERYLDRPEFFPDRSNIGQPVNQETMLNQLSSALRAYAPLYEAQDNPNK
jgi:hypothetical protein